MPRVLRIVAVLLVLCSFFVFSGSNCSMGDLPIDLPNISIDDVKSWAFNEMISLAILAIDRELGAKKEERVDWMATHLKNVFGDLLDWIPGWEASLSKAYDSVWANLNKKLRAHPDYVEGADMPAYTMLAPDDFADYKVTVMGPIEDHL